MVKGEHLLGCEGERMDVAKVARAKEALAAVAKVVGALAAVVREAVA